MSESVKGSICTQCKHRDICKYCVEAYRAESIASKINITLDTNIQVMCARREISYIEVNNSNPIRYIKGVKI